MSRTPPQSHERRFFRKGPPPERRTHHIHLVETTSDFWERHLIFRDYLRLHPGTAREYLAVKLDLAAKHSDVNDYARAKTPFIQAVLEKARRCAS